MVKIKWDNELKKYMKHNVAKSKEALWDALEAGVNEIGNQSEKQVPLEKGTLANSWRVEKLVGEIGYKMSYNTPYAARLHEHPEYHFQNRRKAKYLQQPIDENMGDWQNKIILNLKKTLF